ncbi:MAG: SDR family oxidoreductase [Anaerolineae bacterium]|nr:SDR family oxidoreductase [Anaerolineae bacterium]
MMRQRPLEGKVAIVTGAGRGIGRSIALTLARNGARGSLAARTEAELQAVQSEIESFGGQAASFPTDVSREAEVISLVRNTVERFGRLDILINNAGIGIFGPLVETTTEQWDRIMAINARGPFLLCREAIPYLKKQEQAFIINIASVVGVKGYVNQAAYSASKHAVMGMTKALAKEVQGDGIRVHAICPGGVDTQLLSQARPDLDRSVLMQPEELADIVLSLVTRQGNAVIDEIHVRRAASMPWA